ncbi:MAG: DsbA family protein [Archaeoglobaceae archaeon]
MAEKLVVFSDYVCPFCYIGKTIAQKLVEDYGLEMEWVGYEINPRVPPEGLALEELGIDEEYMKIVEDQVKKYAKMYDIDFKFPEFLPNSRLAIMCTKAAEKEGFFYDFYNAVFDVYWDKGQDIGDKKVLERIAEEIGLSWDKVESYLQHEAEEDYEKALERVEDEEIVEVPTFIIDNKRFQGVKPYNEFQEYLENND